MNFHFLLKLRNRLYLHLFNVLNIFFRIVPNREKLRTDIINGLKSRNKKRVLIINTLGLGDMVVSTPMIKTLHLSFPGMVIDVLINRPSGAALENNTYIDKVFYYEGKNTKNLARDLKKRGYYLSLDLSNSFINLKRQLIAIRSGARYRIGFTNRFYTGLFNHIDSKWIMNTEKEIINYHGILRPLISSLSTPEGPELFFSSREKKSVQELLHKYGLSSDKMIVIHPCSQNPRKLWSVEKFADLIDRLSSLGFKVVITGSKANEIEYTGKIKGKTKTNVVDLTGRLTPRQWFLVIKEASLIISIDTSAIHIASATQTPTVALFGPTNKTVWGPYNTGNQIVVTGGRCISCEKDFKYIPCRFDDIICMKMISVSKVYNAARRLLNTVK